MFKLKKKGQTAVEYTILIIIVLGAFLAMSNYFKRGIQGRWKSAIDDLGDQYDPRAANTSIRHVLISDTTTTILALNANGGFWTMRTDNSTSTTGKVGWEVTEGY